MISSRGLLSYAPTFRYGTHQDYIDLQEIRIIVDEITGHFSKDLNQLAMFYGTILYKDPYPL
ncbi:MAG: hypothetical protein ACQZ3N_06000 [cyanobacterium endosymbiont of Rhopalodia yunnanensis]